jgi:hypothetical protein
MGGGFTRVEHLGGELFEMRTAQWRGFTRVEHLGASCLGEQHNGGGVLLG